MTIAACEKIGLHLNGKYDCTLLCQCPQQKAMNEPNNSPVNLPLVFWDAIHAIASAYSAEKPSSIWFIMTGYIVKLGLSKNEIS